ncbi:hypothetical protein TNCV_220701 [Trichonephila clavipes]|nr:hypothetical protein TNCV_220701 [Trichonephila clavipes]
MCSRATVINICCIWITNPKTRAHRQTSGCHRQLKTLSERRTAKISQSNRRATISQISCNLNQRVNNVSERTVRRTLHRISYDSRRSGCIEQEKMSAIRKYTLKMNCR